MNNNILTALIIRFGVMSFCGEVVLVIEVLGFLLKGFSCVTVIMLGWITSHLCSHEQTQGSVSTWKSIDLLWTCTLLTGCFPRVNKCTDLHVGNIQQKNKNISLTKPWKWAHRALFLWLFFSVVFFFFFLEVEIRWNPQRMRTCYNHGDGSFKCWSCTNGSSEDFSISFFSFRV